MTPLTILRARYVFPVTGEPIPDGFVAVEGGRIVEVGRCRAGVPPAHGSETKTGAGKMPARHTDLGNAAILPGLVNAHAHLDFSGLGAPLGRRGIGLSDWIRLAMDYRRCAADCLPASVAAGLDECLRCGVTTLGDIVQSSQPPPDSLLQLDGLHRANRAQRQPCCRSDGFGKVASRCSPHTPCAGSAHGVCRRHYARPESPRPI